MIQRAVLVLAISIGAVASASQGPKCTDVVGDISTTLTPIQTELLAKLRGTHYTYRILVQGDGDERRTLVLLGDNHRPENAHRQLAQSLIDSFEQVGIEGFSERQYYFSKMFLRFWNRLDEQQVKAGKPYDGALHMAREEQETHIIAKIMDSYFKTREQDIRSGKLTPEAFAKEVDQLVEAGFFKQAEEDVRAGREPSFAKVTSPTSMTVMNQNDKSKYVELEAGHIVGPQEKRSALMFMLAFSYIEHQPKVKAALLLGLLAQLYPPFTTNWGVGATAAGIIIAHYGLHVAAKAARSLAEGALQRNPTMVDNIIKAFVQRPSMTQFLAIAGRGHLEGLSDLLTRRGWREIGRLDDGNANKVN